jgi:diacylglycerol O-acyltransferase
VQPRFPPRMSSTDAVFWHLDRVPELRSTIAALVLLDRGPSRARLRQAFADLAAYLPRLRQRVVEVPLNLAPPEWIDDPFFDLDYHLRYVAVSKPGTLTDLLELVSPLYSTPLDRERPLWEAYVIEGLGDGRGALFAKLHHSLTDGIGGTRLVADLLGTVGCPPTAVARTVDADAERSTGVAARIWRANRERIAETVAVGPRAVASIRRGLTRPTRTIAEVQRTVRGACAVARELLAPRATGPLRQRRSFSHRLAVFEMPVAELDAVRARVGATNNDIILTIIAGALHRWHTSHGIEIHALQALVPVSTRHVSDLTTGNQLALVAVSLPVGEPNPLRRLRVLQGRMGEVKRDQRAWLYSQLARVVSALPLALAMQIGRQQMSRTDVVCTNVPGPTETCRLAGATIQEIYPFAPLAGNHPLALTLYSYRESMWVGLVSDPVVMADVPHFLDYLRESFDETVNVGLGWEPSADEDRPGQRRGSTATITGAGLFR